MWLVISALFVMAALLFLIGMDRYWIPAALAAVASQILIILYWQDAKYGTFANVPILLVIIFAAAATQFNGMVRKEVRHITSEVSQDFVIVSESDIKNLPAPVKRWLRVNDIIGKKMATVLHVRQTGQMRTKPGAKWMPFEAEQFFTLNPPAFVWNAKIEIFPFMQIAGRDKYENGKGNMLIKPLHIYTAANRTGKEIDQGALLRFLAELSWFPQAAISHYLHWEPIDDQHAKVTMRYGDVKASGVYSFDKEGNVSLFEAQRFGDFDGIYSKETWSVAVKGYSTFHGIKIGNKNEVTWKLKKGDFMWLKIEVTNVETYLN